jgi:hypothetical protein
MPRISGIKASMYERLGQAIYEAAEDPARRKALLDDPSGYLKQAGLPANEVDAYRFVVHEDTAATLHLIIPHAVAANGSSDPAYLEQLGRVVIAGTVYPETT